MPSHKHLLQALSRLPRGVRFTSLGRIDRSTFDLLAEVRSIRCSLLEVHSSDGSVRGFAPQDLATLREASQSSTQPAFLVAFTSEQHDALSQRDSRPTLYAALEADEAMSTAPHYQPRFLTPSALRECLHSSGAGSLNPDDYAHRLPEIDAAGATAPDAATAGRIKRFRNSAAKYHAAINDNQPEGMFYTTDTSFLREDATRMPCEVVACPAVEEPVTAAPTHSATLPMDENAPLPRQLAQPNSISAAAVPAQSTRSGQFTLAL